MTESEAKDAVVRAAIATVEAKGFRTRMATAKVLVQTVRAYQYLAR